MSRLSADVAVVRGSFELDVSLAVSTGEVVGVLGSNGAGKSTLLGVLAGLHLPSRGEIVLGERTLSSPDGSVPAYRRRVGLLSQQALLFPHLSAIDNVAFGPRSTGAGRRAARETAERWLAEVDASTLADRKPAQLSGGQAQRVAIARALACDPELLLLDEPFAALDVDATPAIRSLLRRVVRATGVTTLMVTHDVLDAVVLADRIVVLDAGRVVESGTTTEVLARPRSAFAARIAGLDLVPGQSCADGLKTDEGTLVAGTHPDPVDDGERAVALFAPASVAVFRDEPGGSPRTALPVRLAAMEPHGELIRLRAAPRPGGPDWLEGLAADVTPAAVAELGVEPGEEVWFAVKAAEVTVHPAGR
ncbi:ATP-binding cassette domain-containing protein [Actinomycetospora endophytica]|uniref:ATP-binding cassette domain-containing protein n=1 Tax=Actinomycetospora endophytica TaxID=2291215 RepID=A0ABS8P9X8_9PSEU|nr:ATP-binding cassette domain-containing protein [Actinomycetospora endophytica]MCD2194216.1 ATP-binding cassette domain-containing protein [Actinomycetospora endophytica]